MELHFNYIVSAKIRRLLHADRSVELICVSNFAPCQSATMKSGIWLQAFPQQAANSV